MFGRRSHSLRPKLTKKYFGRQSTLSVFSGRSSRRQIECLKCFWPPITCPNETEECQVWRLRAIPLTRPHKASRDTDSGYRRHRVIRLFINKYVRRAESSPGNVVHTNLFGNHKNSNRQNGGLVSILSTVVPACRAGVNQDGRQQSARTCSC